ncbi:ISAzo13 family transposase [Streptomyces microflavus]
MDELEAGTEPLGRVRRPGGGRKRAAEVDPELRPALLALVKPDMRGDPMSPLRWTTKSTRRLAVQHTRQGHRISADTVADLLREEGFSLQANAKTLEGAQHPDRNAQFHYINDQAKEHIAAGDPVISVDTKKKLVGPYKNRGREWEPKEVPVQVKTHVFLDRQGSGKAIPYGIYDAPRTPAGSASALTTTLQPSPSPLSAAGGGPRQPRLPARPRLLITADASGSNGYRTRAWKTELAALAAQTGLEITVCHMPPGTSKWNKIEHRLFSHISMNWRGRPLTSHDVIMNSIKATTTRTGLRVHAELDPGTYNTGIKVTDTDIDALPMHRHRFHGDWNYTLPPATPRDDRRSRRSAAGRGPALHRLPGHRKRLQPTPRPGIPGPRTARTPRHATDEATVNITRNRLARLLRQGLLTQPGRGSYQKRT